MKEKILPVCLIILFTLVAAEMTRAQSRVTCRSNDYRYQKCPADTSLGVKLVEQLSRSECRLGETWGFDQDGVWVDRGCAAVFEVSPTASRVPGPVDSERVASCQQEALKELQRRHGSYARAEFEGTPTVMPEGYNERRVSGQVRVWNGRSSYLATYICQTDSSTGRVLRLELTGNTTGEVDRPALSACQSAIQNRIRRDLGQGVTVGFDEYPRVGSLSRSELQVSGRGWLRTGYSTRNFDYECTVGARSFGVTRAEYREDLAVPLPPVEGWGQCDRFPVLYSDDRFRGRSYELEQSVRDLHSAGFGDSASSVCVPSNWLVTLYQDSEYQGPTLVLEGPVQIADLARDRPEGQNWGDRISSVEVYYRRPDPGVVACDRSPALFGDDSFRGKRVDVTESIADVHPLGLGDNTSSLCVPAGWEITVFVDKGFRGASLRVRGPASIEDLRRDRPQGQDWGDRISSVRVDLRPGRR